MRVTLYSRTGKGPRFSTTKDENALIAYDVEISDAFSPRWKNGTLYINYGGRRAIEKVLNIYHALPVYSRFENGRYIVAPVQVYNMDGVVNIWREPNKSILSPAARQLYENPELKFTLHPETGALLISPDDYAQFLRKEMHGELFEIREMLRVQWKRWHYELLIAAQEMEMDYEEDDGE